MDVEKHIKYWKESAAEDWRAAMSLLEKGHIRHSMFFMHLSVEKRLKAAFVAGTGQPAPRSHDLQRLAKDAGLEVTQDRSKSLARINRFCLEGRYPDNWVAPLDADEAAEIVALAEELEEWLTKP
jgi:HEPN domain-containing protein